LKFWVGDLGWLLLRLALESQPHTKVMKESPQQKIGQQDLYIVVRHVALMWALPTPLTVLPYDLYQ
jgi:hypothetical protein